MAKLMLVEDDNNLREIYEARLQAEGYTIVAARDGEEALVVAKAEKPDLIISDVMMPKISGFEMLDILRNTDGMQDVKVIMLTALGQNDDQARADRLGADRYLVKSQVTLEDIVKVTHELLQDNQDETTPAIVTTPASVAASSSPTPPPAPVTSPPATEPPVAAPPPAEPAAPVIPVVDTPAETATVTVTPAPVPEPPVAPATDEGAQSTAQEEANVEARIEDFVAGATQDASPPVVAAAPTDDTNASNTSNAEPAAPVEPAPTPDSVVTPPSNDSADDKLMADAMQTLAASTPESEAAPDMITPPVEVATPAIVPEPTAEPEVANTSSVPIAHKKVIAPPDSEPKKDIETLVALEEAKQAAAAPPKEPAVVVATDGKGTSSTPLAVKPAQASPVPVEVPAASSVSQTTPAAETIKVDPNSIAL